MNYNILVAAVVDSNILVAAVGVSSILLKKLLQDETKGSWQVLYTNTVFDTCFRPEFYVKRVQSLFCEYSFTISKHST